MLGPSAFLGAVAVNLLVAVIIILLFSVLRRRLINIYYPREHAKINVGLGKNASNSPVPIGGGPGFFEWISSSWSLDESSTQIREQLGADAAFFLILTKALFRLLLIIAIPCVCILLPVHYMGGTSQHLGGAHLPNAPAPFQTKSISSLILPATAGPTPPHSTDVHIDSRISTDASDSDLSDADISESDKVATGRVPRQFNQVHTVTTVSAGSNVTGVKKEGLTLDVTLARAAAPATAVLEGWTVQLASALDSLSIMQLPAGSSYLTLHLFMAYFISMYVYSALGSIWETYFNMRREMAKKCTASQHSIMITGLPEHIRDDKELAARIESACRRAGISDAPATASSQKSASTGNVMAAHIVRQNSSLFDLLSERRRCQDLLDQVSALHRLRCGCGDVDQSSPGDEDIVDGDDGVRLSIDESTEASRPLMRVSARELASALDFDHQKDQLDTDDDLDDDLEFGSAIKSKPEVKFAHDESCFEGADCVSWGNACCIAPSRAPVPISSCALCSQVFCCGCCCSCSRCCSSPLRCSDVGLLACCAPVASALCGRPVDAIEYLEQRLEKLNSHIRYLADNSRGRALWASTDVAFVSMRSLKLRNALLSWTPATIPDATASSNHLTSDNSSDVMPKSALSLTALKRSPSFDASENPLSPTSSDKVVSLLGEGVAIVPAPDPADINWRFFARPDENSFVRRTARSVLISINIVALIVAWSFVSVAVVSMTTLSSLARQHVPVFSWLAHSHHVALFEGVLPAVLLGFALYYLPQMLRAAVRQTGYETGSALEAVVFSRLAMFLYYNQFFVFTVAAVVFEHFGQLASSPRTMAYVLASALPSVGVFFMLFTCLFAAPASALELLRVGALMDQFVLSRPVTIQQQNALNAPVEADVTNLYASHMLILLLALASALAHPLICVFAAAYFGAQLLVFRHQFMHVYRPRSADHVHTIWPAVHTWAMVALFIAQIGFCGLFVLKRGVWQLAAAVPLPFFTVLAWLRAVARAAMEPVQLEHSACAEIDSSRTEGMIKRAIANGAAYDHPAFRELYG